MRQTSHALTLTDCFVTPDWSLEPTSVPPMPKDPSQRPEGRTPSDPNPGTGAGASEVPVDAHEVLALVRARLALPAVPPSGFTAEERLAQARAPITTPYDVTPAPVVVGPDSSTRHPISARDAIELSMAETPPEPLMRRRSSAPRSWVDEENVEEGDSAAEPRFLGLGELQRAESQRGGALAPSALASTSSSPGSPSYQPPRKPPALQLLLQTQEHLSVRVAAEYDPRAPTLPKVRRRVEAPRARWSYGDHWLVGGLLAGGLFVAGVVVVVHRLALSENTPPVSSASPAAPVTAGLTGQPAARAHGELSSPAATASGAVSRGALAAPPRAANSGKATSGSAESGSNSAKRLRGNREVWIQ